MIEKKQFVSIVLAINAHEINSYCVTFQEKKDQVTKVSKTYNEVMGKRGGTISSSAPDHVSTA